MRKRDKEILFFVTIFFGFLSKGMALWMDFFLDKDHVLSSGPVSDVQPGSRIDWDVHSKQGVFFFPQVQQEQRSQKNVQAKVTLRPKEGEFKFDFCLED